MIRIPVFIICFFFLASCYAQQRYDATLAVRINAIRGLDFYNSGIVLFNDSTDHGLDFPIWKKQTSYFQGDLIRFKECLYVATADSKGERPATSPEKWQLTRGPHPYLFLRDTAKVADLRKLLSDEHTYVKTYAFAALAHRKEKGLMEVIVDNLKDKTRMKTFTGDPKDDGFPAAYMIQYEAGRLRKKDKRKLKELILLENQHLYKSVDLLSSK